MCMSFWPRETVGCLWNQTRDHLLSWYKHHSNEDIDTGLDFMPCILTVCVSPDSKVHGANMGPIWVLSATDGPHVGPRNLAVHVSFCLPSYCSPLSFAGELGQEAEPDKADEDAWAGGDVRAGSQQAPGQAWGRHSHKPCGPFRWGQCFCPCLPQPSRWNSGENGATEKEGRPTQQVRDKPLAGIAYVSVT